MGGIIAHRAITRQRSAHSERFAVATPNDPRYGLAPGERLPVRLAVPHWLSRRHRLHQRLGRPAIPPATPGVADLGEANSAATPSPVC